MLFFDHKHVQSIRGNWNLIFHAELIFLFSHLLPQAISAMYRIRSHFHISNTSNQWLCGNVINDEPFEGGNSEKG